ncbi:MAG: carboxypeptidase regulatory-like domain-containing protein [Acidobacteriia bacterium]|nr:carboxypeptidase regulatory-like domain-containing protein [Terriglobia bacterium]
MFSDQSKITRIVRQSLVLALVLSACGAVVFAQVTSGTIFGAVKDPSGAMVPHATVTATNAAAGITRTVSTNEEGGFVLPNLAPGTYAITVETAGFKKMEKTGIVLSAADRLNAGEFVLEVGVATEEVVVTAEAAQMQLQSNSGERSDLISSKQLNDVAMNGRNVLDYMKLIPGVISGFDGHASGTGGLDSMNINGTRANQHEFTIDGASNVDTGNNGGTHVTINPDAIEEVKILTSNYQAEFGKAAGGQIAIVTKGGTNDFHGNVRLFHRNEGMNANEWFANRDQTPIAKYRYNYIGYQLGGPVLIPGADFNKNKDKLFFFWNQEFYRQLIPVGRSSFYTPTALERTGDFSQSVDQGGNPVAIAGAGIVPGTNKIDRNLLDPTQQVVFDQMLTLLNLFPLPNVPGYGSNGNNYNYSVNPSYSNPRREDILRVDYQITSNHRLFGRWIHNSDTATSGLLPGGLGVLGCASGYSMTGTCSSKHPGWNLSVNLVSTIRQNLLNEFSVGPSVTKTRAGADSDFLSRGVNNITMPLFYPLTTGDNIPDVQWWDEKNSQWNWNYLGATPWYQANTTINVNDNLTWVKNSHTLKFGLFYQRNRKDQVAWGNNNGEFQFGNGPTSPGACPANTSCGDAFASMLLGSFDKFIQTNARPVGYFRYNQLEFYVQDTWKVTSRFTLDYGMRFAWIPPQTDAKNQIALFDPASYIPANAVTINTDGSINTAAGGDPLNGMTFTNNGTAPVGGWNSHGIMPEPRLGFAYDLFGTHKTILRGGFGMMHDRTQGNLIYNTVFENAALVQTPVVYGSNIADLPTLAAAAAAGLATQPLSNVYGAARDGKVPTVYSFSLGVQREIARGTTLDVAYVGTLSRHLVTARDINAIPYGYAFTAAAQDPANYTDYCASPLPGDPCTNGIPAVEPGLPPVYAAAGYNFSGAYAYGRQSYSNAPLVPFKGYGQIEYLQFDGTSNYNSLQVSLQRRFTKGLTFGAVYTWSKALTTANSDEDLQDPFLPRSVDYRAAGWDRTHVFAANYVYDLPKLAKRFGGSKWLSYITDNYQLSGVTQFMSGTPIDMTNHWGWESGAADGSNMWGAIQYYYSLDSSGNPVLPAIGTVVRGTRDLLRTGGMQNWDLSLFKNIPLGSNERRYLQIRLEAFNAFNHPNFNNKSYNLNVDGPWQWAYGSQAGSGPASWSPNSFSISKASNWGTNVDTYSGLGGPRVVQLGAKLYF